MSPSGHSFPTPKQTQKEALKRLTWKINNFSEKERKISLCETSPKKEKNRRCVCKVSLVNHCVNLLVKLNSVFFFSSSFAPKNFPVERVIILPRQSFVSFSFSACKSVCLMRNFPTLHLFNPNISELFPEWNMFSSHFLLQPRFAHETHLFLRHRSHLK